MGVRLYFMVFLICISLLVMLSITSDGNDVSHLYIFFEEMSISDKGLLSRTQKEL